MLWCAWYNTFKSELNSANQILDSNSGTQIGYLDSMFSVCRKLKSYINKSESMQIRSISCSKIATNVNQCESCVHLDQLLNNRKQKNFNQSLASLSHQSLIQKLNESNTYTSQLQNEIEKLTSENKKLTCKLSVLDNDDLGKLLTEAIEHKLLPKNSMIRALFHDQL